MSKEPASRLDVLSLQDQLEARLAERQARMDGICPVREDLYRQGFGASFELFFYFSPHAWGDAKDYEFSAFCADELIRQVTINSPERGLLLLRVRDEIRMTIDAYKTLYDSSVTFGTRKQLQAEQGIPEMEKRIEVRSWGTYVGALCFAISFTQHSFLTYFRNFRSISVRSRHRFLLCATKST